MVSPRRSGTPPGVQNQRHPGGAIRISGGQPLPPATNDNVPSLPRRLHRSLPFLAMAALIAALGWMLLG